LSTTRVLNWKRQPSDGRDLKSVRHLSAPVTLPPNFELDKQIPVYDQFNIGSCTANSACACFRFETAQVQGDFSFDPSRLFQYYNSRLLQGWENEDSGAYIRDAFKAMNKYGLALEKTWPYVTGEFATKPSDAAYTEALNNVTVKYASVNQNETEIKQTLLSGAAISFGFNVYDSFFGSWENTTGVMPIPKKTEGLQGGHAVTIIGYDDSKKCFLIQNSWGTDWGLNGKFWMPYSFLLNPNESDDFWCIQEVKVGGSVVPPTPSTVDWETAAKVLFKTARELWAVKKPTIVRLGQALNLPVDSSKNFAFNYNLVKTKLNL
jgi:C1A family cysteine protease